MGWVYIKYLHPRTGTVIWEPWWSWGRMFSWLVKVTMTGLTLSKPILCSHNLILILMTDITCNLYPKIFPLSQSLTCTQNTGFHTCGLEISPIPHHSLGGSAVSPSPTLIKTQVVHRTLFLIHLIQVVLLYLV